MCFPPKARYLATLYQLWYPEAWGKYTQGSFLLSMMS